MRAAEAPNDATELSRAKTLLRVLIVLSFVVLLLRVQALRGLGLTDAEALFASYALHPQPVYLSHPGLIAVVMRWIGGSGVAQPQSVHLFAAALAALAPWVALLGARAADARWSNALLAAIALATLPAYIFEHSALTPDLLLALIWPGAIACAASAIRSERGSWPALLGWLGTGVLTGLGIMSHTLGAALCVAIAVALAVAAPGDHWRSTAPWASLVVTAILAAPVVSWEVTHHFPLLRAHLVGLTARPSLGHAAWVLVGQLVIFSPFPLLAAGLLLKDLNRRRTVDGVARLLWTTTMTTTALLMPIALWSPQASATWLVPAAVPLAFHLARRPEAIWGWLGPACVATAALVAIFGWLWVGTDLPVTALGSRYPRTTDLANQLYAWGPGRRLLAQALEATVVRRHELPVIVGVAPGTCAQAHATVGHQTHVGCMFAASTDYDPWVSSHVWFAANTILLVYDDRVVGNPASHFPNHAVISVSKVDVRRGGQVVRTVRVVALDKVRDVASREPHLRRSQDEAPGVLPCPSPRSSRW